MTELQPAHYTQGACHTAQGDRQVLQSLVCTEGVALDSGGGLAVTTAGSGLGVNVASGAAFIGGDQAATQGMYHVYNDATVVRTHAAADPTDPRIDLVVARVNDAAYSGALNTWAIEIVTGTAAPAPVAPAAPNNSIILAQVSITAGLTGPIPSGNITDTRTTYELCKDAMGVTGLIAQEVFTASGNFVKATYPTAKNIRVRMVGGGGGSGASAAPPAGEVSAGGGGGGGGYVESALIPVTALSASQAVVVGAGGTAGAAAGAGGNGGASTFMGLTASGGTGGEAASTGAPASLLCGVSAGGAAAGGAINVPGGFSGYGFAQNTARLYVAPGGDSLLGHGFSADVVVGARSGLAGQNYGGGASGAGTCDGFGAAAGAAGAPGIVIVEVYG